MTGTGVQLPTILKKESFLPYTMLRYFTMSRAIFAKALAEQIQRLLIITNNPMNNPKPLRMV